MVKRSLHLLVGLLLVAATALAQEPAGSKNQRLIHTVKYASASDLANLLDKHFKSADVQILADPLSNSLLINAPPTLVKEILEHVRQLDRQPRQIALEVVLAEVVSQKDNEGKLDSKQFHGPSEVVLGRVAELQKKGLITDVIQVHLNATENQPARVLQGLTKPFSVGGGKGGKGGKGKGFNPEFDAPTQFRDVGTSAQVTARIPDDRSILMDLIIDDSRVRIPPDGVIVGNDGQGKPQRGAEYVSTTAKTRLSLASGNAVAIEGVRSQSPTGQVQLLIVVMARILNGDAKGK